MDDLCFAGEAERFPHPAFRFGGADALSRKEAGGRREAPGSQLLGEGSQFAQPFLENRTGAADKGPLAGLFDDVSLADQFVHCPPHRAPAGVVSLL